MWACLCKKKKTSKKQDAKTVVDLISIFYDSPLDHKIASKCVKVATIQSDILIVCNFSKLG